jgi:hypothetical protein
MGPVVRERPPWRGPVQPVVRRARRKVNREIRERGRWTDANVQRSTSNFQRRRGKDLTGANRESRGLGGDFVGCRSFMFFSFSGRLVALASDNDKTVNLSH